MSVYEKIVTAYPELIENNEAFLRGYIIIQDDSDGQGDFIAVWDYSKPIPDGLKLGK
jgi:hypothetical protein